MMDRGLLHDQATSSVLDDAGMLAYNLDELAITRCTLSDSINLVDQLWLQKELRLYLLVLASFGRRTGLSAHARICALIHTSWQSQKARPDDSDILATISC